MVHPTAAPSAGGRCAFHAARHRYPPVPLRHCGDICPMAGVAVYSSASPAAFPRSHGRRGGVRSSWPCSSRWSLGRLRRFGTLGLTVRPPRGTARVPCRGGLRRPEQGCYDRGLHLPVVVTDALPPVQCMLQPPGQPVRLRRECRGDRDPGRYFRLHCTQLQVVLSAALIRVSFPERRSRSRPRSPAQG